MKNNRKLLVIGALACVVSISAMATSAPKPADDHYKNLQVLPKNTTEAQMNKIMVGEFEDALGVSCGFCHAANKDGDGLDYVSDTKPEKQIARQMLRMTLSLNREYFKIDTPMVGTANIVITCNTCHKGDTFPDGTGTGQ
ncbi:MAG TPA: c-type cytochrome [Mucilaginibacter sp.]|jgi:cytochrome c553|nr:c-type cytochrome [Mucilaginibacter sp.]